MNNSHLLTTLTSLEPPGLETTSSINLHRIKGSSREALYKGNRLQGMSNRSHRSENQVNHPCDYPCLLLHITLVRYYT